MTNNNCLEKMDINENLEEVFNSNNFWKFFWRTYKLKNDINSFLECGLNMLEDVQINEEMKNSIIQKIYNSSYNQKFIDVIGSYIVDSKYINDELYKYAVLYLYGLDGFSDKIDFEIKEDSVYFYINSKLSNKERKVINSKVDIQVQEDKELLKFKPLEKKDLYNLNFYQVLEIINYIENNISTFLENEEIDNFHKEQIENLLEIWQEDKNYFYQKFDEIRKNGKKSEDCDEEKLTRYMKTRIMSKYYPKALNIFYNYLGSTFISNAREYNKLSFEVNDLIQNKVTQEKVDKLHNLKKFILKLNSFSFTYVFEPIFFSRLCSYLGYDINTQQWKRIKFFMLFGISDSYDEYIKIYDFFSKIETFLGNNFWDKFKVWGFWTVTLPLFLVIFSLFLPLGAFLSLLVLIGGILWKIIKDIKSNTSYKIKLNFGINIVATLSFSVFLGSSVFLTNGDAYKFGYEKLKGAINVLSSTTFADVLNYTNNKGEMWGAGTGNNDGVNNSIMKYNYLEENKSYYDIKTIKRKRNYDKNKIEKVVDKNDNNRVVKGNKKYFSGKKVKLSNGVYLWNLVEKVLTKHTIEKGIKLSKKEKYYKTRQIIKHYISLNIDSIRSSSVSKVSYKMRWNELVKWMPRGYKVDLGQIENIVISVL